MIIHPLIPGSGTIIAVCLGVVRLIFEITRYNPLSPFLDISVIISHYHSLSPFITFYHQLPLSSTWGWSIRSLRCSCRGSPDIYVELLFYYDFYRTKFWTCACGTIWWSNLELKQVAPSGYQICNFGAIWWPNLELIQVAPSGGQIWN